ncbi:hypothetical protein JAAARDRAFT_31809 [Jaapia argillacea MUCL 33604]|uniref:AAA+ ATPase domain-containing protein n=1 Tax=Jaapia argillacea MUCL 33604 TaxID=933084 RepID=A0A067Q3V6_9AGAM|nr:hypothetical protein JAAARDRAFT_31809 [Jaapia argillacea MUCL 33604]
MSCRPFFLCALRAQSLARPGPSLLVPRLAFSTTSRSSPILSLLNRRLLSTSPPRPISLASIFSRSPLPATPNPSTVASISLLEAQANENPTHVDKQLELFAALVDSGVKQGYEVVVNRWERMCEFDPANPLLASDKAFELYLQSLLKLNLTKSFDPAVRRRLVLLAAHPSVLPPSAPTHPSTPSELATPPEASSAPVSPTSASQAPVSPPSTPQAPPSVSQTTPPRNPSEQIAHQVLASAALSHPKLSFTESLKLGSLPSSQLVGSSPPPGTPNVPGGAGPLAGALGAGAGGPANPIVVTLHESKGSVFVRVVRFVVFAMFSAFFILVLFSILIENSGLLKAGGPRQAEFQPQKGKTYKFSDVHGVDEAKEELQDVVEFLKDPTAFATLGGKLPKGILLTGSPGTGKTMLARAVAGEAGVPFLFASGSEFDEMFVGVGAKRVRDLFSTARKRSPSIIFIDELDAIGGKRSSRDQHYMKQTLNQLLVEMDGFEQSEGVVVIAATNFPESLDQALVRPGRFDRIVAVPLPDLRGRVQILKHHIKNVTTAPEVDLTVLARGTPGFSGADLQNLINQAAIQASKERATEVTLKHFEWAKDRIIMGAERKSHYIDEKVKKLTAYHEGGHALAALYTPGAMPLHKVTCVPRGHALGVTSQLPEGDRYSISFKEFLATIDVCMGGRVAEELIYGPENVTSGASSDLQKATQTATRMVKNWGYSDKVGPVYFADEDISPSKKIEIESEVRRLLKEGESRVMALLKSREVELHRLANALVEHETLDLEEVKKVIKGEKIRTIKEVVQEDLNRVVEQEQQEQSRESKIPQEGS